MGDEGQDRIGRGRVLQFRHAVGGGLGHAGVGVGQGDQQGLGRLRAVEFTERQGDLQPHFAGVIGQGFFQMGDGGGIG